MADEIPAVETLFFWQFAIAYELAPTVVVFKGGAVLELGTKVYFSCKEMPTTIRYRVLRQVQIKDLKSALRAYLSIFAGAQAVAVQEVKAHLDSLLAAEATDVVVAFLIEPV